MSFIDWSYILSGVVGGICALGVREFVERLRQPYRWECPNGCGFKVATSDAKILETVKETHHHGSRDRH